MTTDVRVTELAHVRNGGGGSPPYPASVVYFDHQPGDATRYELLAVDLGGKGIHLGRLGYIGQNAVVVICGMGDGRAYLFSRGDTISEFYVAEKFGLSNEHTIHHITELVARAIHGEVVGCRHEVAGS